MTHLELLYSPFVMLRMRPWKVGGSVAGRDGNGDGVIQKTCCVVEIVERAAGQVTSMGGQLTMMTTTTGVWYDADGVVRDIRSCAMPLFLRPSEYGRSFFNCFQLG